MRIAILCLLLATLCGCSIAPDGHRYYSGPPLTVGGSYTTPDGTRYGADIHLDPTFARQKK